MFMATGYVGGSLPYLVASTAQFQLTAPLASSASFTVGLGPAHPTRIVVACAWIGTVLGSAVAVSGITIDGTAGTAAAAAGPTTAANVNRFASAIRYRALPTGTSITVTVTSAVTTNQFFGVHCFSLYRARNSAPSATASVGTGTNIVSSISASAAIPAGGVYIIGGGSSNATAPITVNYANPDTDTNAASCTGWHGYDIRQSAATPTFTRTPSSTMLATMCMVTWR